MARTTARNAPPPPSQLGGRWLAESFRASFFFPSTVPELKDVWARIAGGLPDAIVDRPAQGVRQASGAFGNGILWVNQFPGRADVVYTPKEPDQNELQTSPFVQVGAFLEAEPFFTEKLGPSLSSFIGSVRVAYNVAALIVKPSITEANRLFEQLMPDLSFDPENDNSVELQINKPKQIAELDGLKVNRVFKWQVAEMQLIQIASANPVPSKLLASSMCRLELDISTDHKGTIPFDANKSEKIIREMQAEATNIFMNGVYR